MPSFLPSLPRFGNVNNVVGASYRARARRRHGPVCARRGRAALYLVGARRFSSSIQFCTSTICDTLVSPRNIPRAFSFERLPKRLLYATQRAGSLAATAAVCYEPSCTLPLKARRNATSARLSSAKRPIGRTIASRPEFALPPRS